MVCRLNRLPCLAHVVNLGVVNFMSHITKIATIENATAIWEYDPSLDGNRVLGGSLDVIAAIRTLAIKVSHEWTFINLMLTVPTPSALDSSFWPADRIFRKVAAGVQYHQLAYHLPPFQYAMGYSV